MSYTHLTPTERGQVQAYLQEGKSMTYIADTLGRATSSISREMKRNGGLQVYKAEKAQHRYHTCRKPCRPSYKLDYPRLFHYVMTHITEGWTPEIIAGRLPLEFPDDGYMRISHEALYQAIYTDERLHCLIQYLPQARPKRRKRGQGKTRRGPSIQNRIGIEQRPEEVEARIETGHWEGDTIVGSHHQGFLVTLVERSTRLTLIRKVDTKNADDVAQALIDAFSDMPRSWLKTVTFDNGTEFAKHEKITQALGINVYFAHPYSSYERGTNENTNGLIRRFLPKGTDFRNITQQQIDVIEELLNNRPRKILQYRTPNSVFMEKRKMHCVALGT